MSENETREKIKAVYPFVMNMNNTSEEELGFDVTIPDWKMSMRAYSFQNASARVKKAIEREAKKRLEEGKEIPKPNSVKYDAQEGEMIALVNVEY